MDRIQRNAAKGTDSRNGHPDRGAGSSKNRRSGLWVLLVIVLGTVGLSVWFIDRKLHPSASLVRQTLENQQQQIQSEVPSVATQWNWSAIDDEQINRSASYPNYPANNTEQMGPDLENTPLNVVVIFNALQNVKLTETGDVVVDDDALQSLQRFLDTDNLYLNESGLGELTSVIQAGLPGEAGVQVANIVSSFYQYQLAKKEFDVTRLAPSTPDALENYYRELQTIREQTLGYEVAGKLFQKEDAQTLYTIESMALLRNDTLNDADRMARQQALQEKYLTPSPDIVNWDNRFQAYKSARSQIESAGLSDNEKAWQLEELARQHFTEAELAEVDLNDPGFAENIK